MQKKKRWWCFIICMLRPELKNAKIYFNEKISFLIIKKNKFLLVKSSSGLKFFLIPIFVSCYILNNCLFVESKNSLSFSVFIKSLIQFKKFISIKFKKKLKLVGLGFKLNISPDSLNLNLKLGFSHTVDFTIPSNISLSVKKNTLIADGFNRACLGNFLSKIRNLKSPDVYKGKGFWYASEKEFLKQIKKK